MVERVLPGDQLGFSEEFVAGAGVFEQDGVIYAGAAGVKLQDAASRTVGVTPRRGVRRACAGDVAYGVVENLMESIAIVRFAAVPQGCVSPVSHTDSAYLRVSEIMPAYVEKFRDYLRVGDVIRARVLEVKPLGTYLTLKGRDLGVVKAYCSRCRSGMNYRDGWFYCPKCPSRERRKVPEQ